jgi:CHAT domain-containing protein
VNEAIRLRRELKLSNELQMDLVTRASVLSALGRFEDALTDAREALAIVEQIRNTVLPSDFLKRGYNERVNSSYAWMVNALSRLGRGSEALEVNEQGRSRAFLDLLAGRESSDPALATPGPGVLPQPSGADLASEALGKPLDAAGISRTAGRLKSTILNYWVVDDAVLIWIVRPGLATTHVRVPVASKKLGDLVAATTAALRGTSGATATRGVESPEAAQVPDDDLMALPMRGLGVIALAGDDKSAWRELYKTLIDPVRAQLPARGSRLTIVPHGPLFQLSFAALQSTAGRYLVEDYELAYAPAISVLDFTGRRQQETAATKGPWTIVGNPQALPSIGSRPLQRLPGAEREIATIAAIAPKGSGRLEGAGADEAALGRALNASHPSVLHFATHGFVFDDPKKQPFLALNRRSDKAAEDGRLTLDEVYGLTLNTDLVVLSACRSGSGRISSDGVIGLTRGFFYAGSPSVLATFWDVVDESTERLMSGFYRQYVKSHAKGASLRSAQLALLADLRAGKVIVTAGGREVTLPEHPLLWAAFFLSGEP